ncbi:MAG: NRDE family protein [Pseudomonadaceae bacterium]|nr:NRDE family protein [Pseudomonadaceae bacterium]
MCLLALSWQQTTRYPLVLASNRDEFLPRPTRPACFWPEQPNLLGSKDLEAGGSWLLASQQGRWATLTNFRDGRNLSAGNLSRGELVLQAMQQPLTELPKWLEANRHNFAGYNLLWGDNNQAWYFSNRLTEAPRQLEAGLYLLSNATLNTDWPKTRRLKKAVEIWQTTENCHPDQLFATLTDPTPAQDKDLPNTYIGLEKERFLSSIFIKGESYATRTSTLLWQEADGYWHLHEKNHATDKKLGNEHYYKWQSDLSN